MKPNTIATASKWFWARLNFEGRVVSSELDHCWEWTGRKLPQGYGHVKYQGILKLTHHVAYMLIFGKWPDQDLCHKCDNPPCVRPDHFFLGNDFDNQRDAVRKGRRGKLGLSIVRYLRSIETSASQRAVAVQLGVNQSNISRAIAGRQYSEAVNG
jgi:hypothetical protein